MSEDEGPAAERFAASDEPPIRQRWEALERTVRARLGPAGVSTLDEIRKRSGLDFLLAIGQGALPSPPICHTLRFWPVEVEPGRMVFQGTPGAEHYNPIGSVHGGYAATLLDSAVGCAVQSMLPQGSGYTTLELKINYVRALTERTGPVRAEGKIITVGRQAATAEGRLTDAAGKLYAFATTTCLVFTL